MNIAGIGSGTDWEQLVMAIVNQEKAPKNNQIVRQEQRNTAEIEALKDIQKEINSLSRTVKKLNFANELTKTKATVNDETIATVTSGSQAIAGEYNFEVKQLALTQRDRLLQVEEGSTFDSGTIKFTSNSDGKVVEVDLAALSATKGSPLTIEEVQEALNQEASKQGVSAKATLVRSQGEISLVLNAGESGTTGTTAAPQQPFTVNSTLSAVATGNINGGHVSLQAAQNAQVTYGTGAGAMTLTSSSNKMENIVDGISLDLKKTGTVNVKIEQDHDKSKESIREFIDGYNKLLESVSEHTNAKDNEKAALSGNGSVRSMVSRMRGTLSETYPVSGFGTLAQLGITTNRSGQLEIDDKKLDKALADDPTGVAKLLAGDSTQDGLMDKLTESLSSYKSAGGIYSERIDSLEASNARYAKQLDELDQKMLARADSLRSYYAAMESRIVSMQQTQMSLASLV